MTYPNCCRSCRRSKQKPNHEPRSVKIVDRVSAVEAIKRLNEEALLFLNRLIC